MIIAILVCVFKSSSSAETKSDSSQKRDRIREISPVIEIWSHTGNKYLIHSVEPIKDQYNLSKGWSIHGPYPPKKFDVKLLLIDEGFDNKRAKDFEKFSISVMLKFRAGQDGNSRYMLNPTETKQIEVLKNRIVKQDDFKNGETSIWIKNIEFEKHYLEFEKQAQNLNQIIFFITITNINSQVKYLYEYLYFARTDAY